ncbi:MAG: peptidylprolyl isomerase [Gemmatimonadota bacterium]|nr:MAG: peptidylprolyl isomerase [Gemmatimonadota bacterium]
MSQAKNGDTVKVHYTGKLDDGTVFDSSAKREPLEFTLGKQQLISGFEDAVRGMSAGDSKTIRIPPDKGYGPHRPELVFQVGREAMPANLEPEVGQHLEMQQQDGRTLPLMVTEVSEASVTLDANHPLAGKELTFELELVEIGGD